MANAYEELNGLLMLRPDDYRFYMALRRLYYSNVAAYLCQYHDDSPLTAAKLTAIDSFMELEGKRTPGRSLVESAHDFLDAWAFSETTSSPMMGSTTSPRTRMT